MTAIFPNQCGSLFTFHALRTRDKVVRATLTQSASQSLPDSYCLMTLLFLTRKNPSPTVPVSPVTSLGCDTTYFSPNVPYFRSSHSVEPRVFSAEVSSLPVKSFLGLSFHQPSLFPISLYFSPLCLLSLYLPVHQCAYLPTSETL